MSLRRRCRESGGERRRNRCARRFGTGVLGSPIEPRLSLVAVKLLLIDNYDSFTYNLVQRHRRARSRRSTCTSCATTRSCRREEALAPTHLADLSPGPCTPSEIGYLPRPSSALPRARIPILGVCLGHQAIADVARHVGRTGTSVPDARQDLEDPPRRTRASSRASRPVHRHALPLAHRRSRRRSATVSKSARGPRRARSWACDGRGPGSDRRRWTACSSIPRAFSRCTVRRCSRTSWEGSAISHQPLAIKAEVPLGGWGFGARPRLALEEAERACTRRARSRSSRASRRPEGAGGALWLRNLEEVPQQQSECAPGGRYGGALATGLGGGPAAAERVRARRALTGALATGLGGGPAAAERVRARRALRSALATGLGGGPAAAERVRTGGRCGGALATGLGGGPAAAERVCAGGRCGAL